MKNLNLFFVLFLLVNLNVHAEDLDTNYVTFNLSGSGAEVVRNETSSSPGFISLNNKSKIPTFNLQGGLAKEFLAEDTFSFTIGAEYGVLFGKTSNDLIQKDLSYSDKAAGSNYGASGTVNMNFVYGKMRFHPFAGFHFLKSKTDYKLTYMPFQGTTPQTNIDYSEDGNQSFLMGGVRFFDQKSKLFSVICVEYELSSSFTKNIKAAKMNGVDIQLTEVGEVKHAPVRVTLGFGLIF